MFSSMRALFLLSFLLCLALSITDGWPDQLAIPLVLAAIGYVVLSFDRKWWSND